MIHRVRTSGTTSGTTRDNEWQRMTASGNEWQQVTMDDNEWQQMTTNDNEWQRVVMLAYFPFISNKRGTYYYAP